MARVNYDDSIESDFRFRKLVRIVKNEFAARGMLVHFWRIAQDHWGEEKSLVPLQLFLDEKLGPILECGLAEQRDKLVYAKGSEKYFDWYLQRCRASKSAKLKRSRSPGAVARTTGTDIPNDPLPLPLPLPKENKNIRPEQKFDFEAVYKRYPRKEGKAKGIEKCRAQIKTPEDYTLLSQAIDRYTAHTRKEKTELRFIKHFSTFMEAGAWRDWLDPDAGAHGKSWADKPHPALQGLE